MVISCVLLFMSMETCHENVSKGKVVSLTKKKLKACHLSMRLNFDQCVQTLSNVHKSC